MTMITDDNLRALMSRVEDLTPSAPEFESLERTRAAATRGVWPRQRSLVAVAATFTLVIAGLVLIGSRESDAPPLSEKQLTVHSVVTRLPDGWEIKGGIDGKADVDVGTSAELHLFATAASPAGPVLGVLDTWSGTYADETTQTNVVLDDGRRAALGLTHFAGARSLDVEVAPGQWVGLIARHINDADLLAIGRQIVADPAGTASVVGSLPGGLVAAGDTTALGNVMTNTFGSDANEFPTGATVTGYGPMGVAFDTSVVAFAPTSADRALLGMLGDVTTMSTVGGAAVAAPTFAAVFGDHDGNGAYVEHDGVGFFALSATLDAGRLADMLDSLEPVDGSAWAQLVDRHGEGDPSPPNNTTTDSTMTPPPTVADGAADPARVDIDYAITATDDGYDAVAEIPAGQVTMHVRTVGRSTLVDMSLGGKQLASTTISSISGGSYSMPRDPDGSYSYVYVVPTDDPSAEMRVTVDGFVYATPFVTIDPTYPVKIAMILVPPIAGRSTPAKGYLYESNGRPLDSLG